MVKRSFLFLIGIFTYTLSAGADYQWSVPAPIMTRGGIAPTAYLWIPPQCEYVRGAVLAQDKVIPHAIFNSQLFRQAMADIDFALVWTDGKWDPLHSFKLETSKCITTLLDTLASVSGYDELSTAPIVPIGYSWHASYPWNFAAANPERTLAILSIHGDAPLTNLTGCGRPNPDWGERNIDGIPGLQVMGEYEFTEERLRPALLFQKKYPNAIITVLPEKGMSHHSFTDEMISFLGLYLRKVSVARLPENVNRQYPLRKINKEDGWLIDRWRAWQKSEVHPAPYSDYLGNKEEAFWCLDKEMALAALHMYSNRTIPQLIGFQQDGTIIQQDSHTMQQTTLSYEPLEDGESFTVTPIFLKRVPSGDPEWWSNRLPGDTISHSLRGGPITFSSFGLEVEECSPRVWHLSFNRAFPAVSTPQTATLWLLAKHIGDDLYKACVAPCGIIDFPLFNEKGEKQAISFPHIADITCDIASVELNARSDKGLPVRYYVQSGPAEIMGNHLKIIPIPPRAKFPLIVTVVAWQYGRAKEPYVQSAIPVTRTFKIFPSK